MKWQPTMLALRGVENSFGVRRLSCNVWQNGAGLGSGSSCGKRRWQCHVSDLRTAHHARQRSSYPQACRCINQLVSERSVLNDYFSTA